MHVNFFTPSSLRHIAQRNGFKVVQLRTRPLDELHPLLHADDVKRFDELYLGGELFALLAHESNNLLTVDEQIDEKIKGSSKNVSFMYMQSKVSLFNKKSLRNSDVSDFNLEIVIVDNYSTDGTSEYLKTIADQNIRIINPPERLSIDENWTFAVNAAQGDFIKLLCADDILASNCLQDQLRLLTVESSQDLHAVFGSRNFIDEDGREIWQSRKIPFPAGPVEGREILLSMAAKGTNVLGEPLTGLFKSSAL